MTKEEIDQEYTKCCMALGDIEYKKACLENDGYKIKTRMAELNKQALEEQEAKDGKAE